MHRSVISILLACAASVRGFADSSPFILFSTAPINTPLSNDQLQSSNQIVSSVGSILSACPTERYILISQPDVHAGDIRSGSSGCRMPNLCRAVESADTQGRFSVAEVMGRVAFKPLREAIQAACVATGRQAVIDEVVLSRPPGLGELEKRQDTLSENDFELGRRLEALSGQYTVLFFSDPNEFSSYEPEFAESVHMDLKRDVIDTVVGRRADENLGDLPLFERYQFFTPAVFSGLVILIIVLSILTVGLKALSSLEVSYGAFDKDMGPSAQKKQL